MITFQYKGNLTNNELGFHAANNIFIKRIYLLDNRTSK